MRADAAFDKSFSSLPLTAGRYAGVGIRRSIRALVFLLLLCVPVTLGAQETPKDLTRLSLEELMNIEVYSASRHAQKIDEAPASVTVVTREEIQHYGYRTLADVLRNVRGFFVNYDRNYSYVGVRGFAPPGDYNSRILLLLDGHRMNDNIYDQAYLGVELPLDLDMVERIEIIRGPSSSLYGADAFFGVINIITRSHESLRRGRVSTEVGSFGSYKGQFAFADKILHKVDLLLAGSVYESSGPSRLFFPEFNAPATNNGIAMNADDEASRNILARLVLGSFTLESATGWREKGVPTASYQTLFNDPRTRTTDSSGNLVLTFDRKLAEDASLLVRASYNRYEFGGDYANASENGDGTSHMNRDYTRGDWWGLEGQFRKRILRRHDITLGAEVRDNIRQDQFNYDVAPYRSYLDVRKTSTISAGFVQDEFRIHPRVTLNAGVRYDHYTSFGGTTNPRLGLLIRPTARTTVKVLYGQAFRAPNVYEMYYADSTYKTNPELRPETIRTFELATEHYLGSHVQLSSSGYLYRINGLIRLAVDPGSGLLMFQNSERVHAKGLEFEMRGRWARVETSLSYSVQNSIDASTRAILVNSPKHLAKSNVLFHLWRDKVMLGAEGRYTSNRKVLTGDRLGGFGVVNLTLLTRKIAEGAEVSCTVYNVFDKRYSSPGGSEHVQSSLQQDGRSLRLKVSYSF